MKITTKMKRTLIILLTASLVTISSVTAQDTAVTQRADNCLILISEQAKADGRGFIWKLDIERPGNYYLQLIIAPENALTPPDATVKLDDGKAIGGFRNEYVIEDGVVAQAKNPVSLSTGQHTISIESKASFIKARLIPQGFVNSKMEINSDHYYDKWRKLHESPEKQAAMEWYREARFGMFIHWGVYSAAAGSWDGKRMEKSGFPGPRVAEWVQYKFRISREEYREFAKEFKPDRSFAVNIAQLAKATGMKYVVITSKHHDGFCLFDSKHSDFDIADATSYDGDLIKELYDACRAEGLDFGVYYSHCLDWMDGADGGYKETQNEVKKFGVSARKFGANLWDPSPNSFEDYLEKKSYPQVRELIELLPDLRLIWFDFPSLLSEEESFKFYNMVYELNPSIIVNRRVGYGFGDYIDAGDNKTPKPEDLTSKHFETCGTANHSWGFKAYDHQWKSPNELLRNFVDIVSKGGNYLLNIGPDKTGTVPETCVESFHGMGEWVKTNSEAIFNTETWHTFYEGEKKTPSSEFWFSAKDDKVYAMALAPAVGKVKIVSLNKAAGKVVDVQLLGSEEELSWTQTSEALSIDFTEIVTCEDGYAIKVTIE